MNKSQNKSNHDQIKKNTTANAKQIWWTNTVHKKSKKKCGDIFVILSLKKSSLKSHWRNARATRFKRDETWPTGEEIN